MYGQNQTKFTDYSGNVQIVQFNNMGNTISVQDDQGRAQYARYARNDPTDTSAAKGNQLTLSSKMQNTVGNVLKDTSFEGSTLWTVTSSDVTRSINSSVAYHGEKSLRLYRTAAGTAAGVYSAGFTVASGETYTFSAYVKTASPSAYLALYDGSTSVVSETLPSNNDWTRLEVSYTNTSSAAKTVTARLMTAKAGAVYMDCVQVEKAPTASRYNLVQNGNFTYSGHAWSSSSGRTSTTTAPAPQLDNYVYHMAGNYAATDRLSQTVNVSGSKNDTFVLAGWAKADSVPLTDNREFALIATFKNGTTTVNTVKVRFNPCVKAWQYAAEPIVAGGAYTAIELQLAYDYNANTAYFDGIQLFKEEFGNSYTYDANGNVTSVKDIQGKTTSYTYENNDLIEQVLPTGAVLTYTYDDYHNVKTATSDTGVVYSFTYDTYGNNTSVSIASGSVKLTSSAAYTSDGTRVSSTTDASGKTTAYYYHDDLYYLMWVKYPNDTAATRTEYTYDSMYRLATAAADVSTGTTLSASYGYTNDLLTSITTGSTTYAFTYGAFALRSNIKIGTRTLATYSYTSRNNYLDTLAYGNGDSVQYTYDKQGRVTKQTYEDGDTVTYKYDNNGDLATVTDSSGLSTTYFYDFAGRLSATSVKDGSSTLLNWKSIYNANGQQTGQSWKLGSTSYSETYAYHTEDNSLNTMVSGTGTTLTMTYDALRRSTGFSGGITQRQYTYIDTGTTATTKQIGTVSYPDLDAPLTWTYTYDANGNIAAISDPIQGSKSYTYDSQNQLLTEKIGSTTYTYTYDNAGNLLTANNSTGSHTYTYGDSSWGDLLTKFDGQSITYDEIGNPTSYYNGTRWTFAWEHGRQLASASNGTNNITFTYDANGLRHTKTVDGVVYTYYYAGDKLVRETFGSNVIDFFYDPDGRPYAMKYNGLVLYYVLNQQGDVVRLVDSEGVNYGSYKYDAWGNILQKADTKYINNNPLRYRGYVYDAETGLYYLQSRYYDPVVGRFINADALVSIGQGLIGNNMFAYCLNNPICMKDDSGCYPIYVITDSTTDESEENGQIVYTTTITFFIADDSNPWSYLFKSEQSVSFSFKISNGIIIMSNNQKNASLMQNYIIALELASEMLEQAKKLNKDALSGRTIDGLAFEIAVHSILYTIGVFLKNAEPIEMGGTQKDGYGYDYNAEWFENPINNLDDIFGVIIK